jgi:hypothetical protein
MCTNHPLRDMEYWSSTLDSRHDCSTSVCCKCGHWVNLHQEEAQILSSLQVKLCDWTLVLKQRDALEYGALAMGRFLLGDKAPMAHIYILSSIVPETTDQRLMHASFSPPMIFLWAAASLRRV